ncbi:unnamed protein product [Ranitomeya imitator]|uniref:G-protein coupled receptors family 1 profile domain-containing protein n=1 Tax=Ranitomeya imitator TaxID=111125 RepID=A0ABN9L0E2_9NEOB|nr:unnamed protein product [Ranitomeya imitator]
MQCDHFYNETHLLILNETEDTQEQHSLVMKTFVVIVLLLFISLTVLGNTLVMVAFIIDKRLRTQSNFFLLNLAICDFFIGAFNTPLFLQYMLTRKWRLGKCLCKLWLVADYTMSTASVLNIVLISYDRFFSVTQADNGRAITVNSERYLSMIQDYFQPALEAMELEDTWFQQDGATAHTARVTMNCLRQMFPGRLISLRGDVNWPARSPDLAPCDFFLWGYLKSKVYINCPNTLEDLRNNIEAEIGRIPVDMLVHYRTLQKRHSVTLMKMTAVWIMSFLLYSPSILFWESAFGESHKDEDVCTAGFFNTWYFHLATSVFDFFLPLISISFFNLSIYWSISKRSKKKRQKSACDPLGGTSKDVKPFIISNNLVLTSAHITETKNISLHVRKTFEKSLRHSPTASTSPTQMTNIPNTIHVVNLSRDKKVAKSLGILVSVFAACWAPYTFLVTIDRACQNNCVALYWYDITVWILYLNSTINPILYPLCHKSFRKAFNLILKMCLKTRVVES